MRSLDSARHRGRNLVGRRQASPPSPQLAYSQKIAQASPCNRRTTLLGGVDPHTHCLRIRPARWRTVRRSTPLLCAAMTKDRVAHELGLPTHLPASRRPRSELDGPGNQWRALSSWTPQSPCSRSLLWAGCSGAQRRPSTTGPPCQQQQGLWQFRHPAHALVDFRSALGKRRVPSIPAVVAPCRRDSWLRK